MSQYMPSTAVSSDTFSTSTGRAAHSGSPVARLAAAAARASQSMRPLRCHEISSAISAVAAPAAAVAPIASPAAAPPAGSAPVACAAKVCVFMYKAPDQRRFPVDAKVPGTQTN